MATTKKTTTKKVAKKEDKVVDAVVVTKNSVIVKALVTEKAAALSEMRAYTFLVAPNATKSEIKKAVKAQYKVTPIAIRTVTLTKKRVMPRGRRGGKIGSTGGGKKAYVYLKKGDKIEVL